MSKSPAWPDIDASLMHLLESSLDMQCLIAGSNDAVLVSRPLQLPYTLIGQNTKDAITIQPPNGKPIVIPPGGGYILPEGQLLNIYATSQRPQMYHWSHLRFRVLGNLDLFDIVQSPYGVSPKHGKQIGLLNQQLAHISHTPGRDMLQQIAQRKLATAKMLALVLELCPTAPGAMQKLVLLSRFQSVFEFIASNLQRPVFRDELSDIAGLSPSRFHSCFQQATGLSPMAYVTQLRLKKAQELLLASAAPVHTIAQEVGFRDPFHFSRTFSKHLGQSPSHYRQYARTGLMNEGR